MRGDPKQQNQNPSQKEAGLDASRHTRVSLEGEGEEFFLDILFYRMSVIEIYRQQSTFSV